MNRIENPLSPKNNRLAIKSAEIKNWVREELITSEDTTVTVIELACRDEGCPDIETVIGIMEPDKPIHTLRIHLCIADVTLADIREAAVSAKQLKRRGEYENKIL